jgi:hypothetical protein
MAAAILTASLGLTGRDYFGRYARVPDPAYLFVWGGAELARAANAAARQGKHAFVDQRLWDNFPSLWFLIPPDEQVTVFGAQRPPRPSGPSVIFAWPYEDPHPILSHIPAGMRVAPARGPLARGDLEPEPYSLYSVYELSPFAAVPPLATFAGGFKLLGCDFNSTSGQVRLVWRVDWAPGRDYQVYAAALGGGGEVLAQADGPLGLGLYPSSWWRPGEVVQETRAFSLPPGLNTLAAVQIGLYDLASGERLKRTDAPGDVFELPLR